MEAGPPDPPAHVHRLPKFVRLALAGLCGAVFLLLIALGLMAVYVYQQQLYIEGRGEFRDREAARIEAENLERTRRAACDLLDTFPAGLPALERARAKYDCGPGIPRALLTPEEQARITPPTTPPARPAAAPDLRGGVVLTPPSPQPGPPPRPDGAPPRATSPEPPPPSPVGPLTGQVCDLTGICIPEP